MATLQQETDLHYGKGQYKTFPSSDPFCLLIRGNRIWEALKSSQPLHFPILQQKFEMLYLQRERDKYLFSKWDSSQLNSPPSTVVCVTLAPSYQQHAIT